MRLRSMPSLLRPKYPLGGQDLGGRWLPVSIQFPQRAESKFITGLCEAMSAHEACWLSLKWTSRFG